MRRTPTTDHHTLEAALGAAASTSTFDRAFRTLSEARVQYDRLRGNADAIPALAAAAARLDAARAEMASLTRIA